MRIRREFKPTYVLWDLRENKALGYYHIMEHEELDKDVDKFLAENQTYREGDLMIKFDKYGLTLPEINKIPEIGL